MNKGIKGLYQELFSKPIRHHFNVIKIFRTSYSERFNINGYDGFFSWHKYKDQELYFITIKKGEYIISETAEINDMYPSFHDIKISKEDVCISVKPEQISNEFIKTIRTKDDTHIISCACCKRPYL